MCIAQQKAVQVFGELLYDSRCSRWFLEQFLEITLGIQESSFVFIHCWLPYLNFIVSFLIPYFLILYIHWTRLEVMYQLSVSFIF